MKLLGKAGMPYNSGKGFIVRKGQQDNEHHATL